MALDTKPPESPGDEKMIQMSEDALRRLLNDVQHGGAFLPPGAYRDADSGIVYREVQFPTGRVKETKAADGKTVTRRQQIIRKQKRLVMLVADPSPTGLLEAIKKAKRSSNEHGPDVYHPRYGWLRGGFKREVDVPENLGTGAERFDMELIDIEGESDTSGSTVTMQGVPLDDLSETAPTGLASFSDAVATDGDVPKDPASAGRRNKEN